MACRDVINIVLLNAWEMLSVMMMTHRVIVSSYFESMLFKLSSALKQFIDQMIWQFLVCAMISMCDCVINY